MPVALVDDYPWVGVPSSDPPIPYHLRPNPQAGAALNPIVLDASPNTHTNTKKHSATNTVPWLSRTSDKLLERLVRICLDLPPDGQMEDNQKTWHVITLREALETGSGAVKQFPLHALLHSGSHRISKTAFKVFFTESRFRMFQDVMPASMIGGPLSRYSVTCSVGRSVLTTLTFRGWHRIAIKRLELELRPLSTDAKDLTWIKVVSMLHPLGFRDLEMLKFTVKTSGRESLDWRRFFRKQLEKSCDGLMAEGKSVAVKFEEPMGMIYGGDMWMGE